MNHPELLPTAETLPSLQRDLDSFELDANGTMLLMAAGPELAKAADPLADLAEAIERAAPPDAAKGNKDENPFLYFLDRVEHAKPEQTRALVVLALQKSWISEGVALPGGGLSVSD